MAVSIISDQGVKRISDAINLSNISIPCADFERIINTPEIPNAYRSPMNASCDIVRLDASAMASPASKAKASESG
jgi:hypothetical protein